MTAVVSSRESLGDLNAITLQPAHHAGLADAQPLGNGVGAGMSGAQRLKRFPLQPR